MTRQKKTERQRAEEALGVAERKVERLTTTVKKVRKDLAAFEAELDEATELRNFLKKHPALATAPNTPGTPATQKETVQS